MTKLSRLVGGKLGTGLTPDGAFSTAGMQWNGFILVAPLDRDGPDGVDPQLSTCVFGRFYGGGKPVGTAELQSIEVAAADVDQPGRTAARTSASVGWRRGAAYPGGSHPGDRGGRVRDRIRR